jgi:hypothetical protein
MLILCRASPKRLTTPRIAISAIWEIYRDPPGDQSVNPVRYDKFA